MPLVLFAHSSIPPDLEQWWSPGSSGAGAGWLELAVSPRSVPPAVVCAAQLQRLLAGSLTPLGLAAQLHPSLKHISQDGIFSCSVT